MKTYKKITVVDENDTLIGYEEYPKAIAEGMIRRVACVFVRDASGRFLLQKRSEHVRCPYLFDAAATGHVDEGESYEEAALRETKEEIGLESHTLKEINPSFRAGECFNGIYRIDVQNGTPISFDEHEIVDVVWMTPDEIDELVESQPPQCVDSFLHIWKTLRATLTT